LGYRQVDDQLLDRPVKKFADRVQRASTFLPSCSTAIAANPLPRDRQPPPRLLEAGFRSFSALNFNRLA
jgi:hypothetical protein